MPTPTLYASIDDMLSLYEEAELLEVTNLRDQSAETINFAKLSTAIANASSTADGYLLAKYTLPLDSTNTPLLSALRLHVCHIARYLLDGSTEEVQEKYKSAIAYLGALTRFSNGNGSSGAASGIDITNTSGSYAVVRDPYWSADRLGALF